MAPYDFVYIDVVYLNLDVKHKVTAPFMLQVVVVHHSAGKSTNNTRTVKPKKIFQLNDVQQQLVA